MNNKIVPNPKKVQLRTEVDARLAAMDDGDRMRQSKIIVEKREESDSSIPRLWHLRHELARGANHLRYGTVLYPEILQHPKYREAKRISLFLSLPSEVNTMPLLNDILLRGDAPFVPQYFRGKMRMLRVMPGDMENMPETSWGIKQHSKDMVREDALDNGGLDLVVAPGAAFTLSGYRCGHGGGYYDRYLTELLQRHEADPGGFWKPYILAVAFNQQVFDEVPLDPQDVRVDEVVTAC